MSPLHQQQLRSQQTHALLLESAMKVLRTSSPEELRIPEICKECDTNSASAYYHFGSKEGLVTEAYVELYKQNRLSDVEGFELMAEVATSPKEVIQLFTGSITDPSTSEERKNSRNIRARVYAAALVNHELAKQLADLQDEYLARATKAMETFQRKGIASQSLSAHQYAVLLESLFVSRSINDTHANPESDESWAQIAVEVLNRFLIH
jgi:AcrR family transcriptional regulator